MKKSAVKAKKGFIAKITLKYNKLIIGSIILNVLYLLFGILIYRDLSITQETAQLVFGLYLIIFGLYSLYLFLIKNPNTLYNIEGIMSILQIVFGLLVIINPFKLIKILTIALGSYQIILGTKKIIEAQNLKHHKYEGWSLIFTIAIILIIFGLFIIINPMGNAYAIVEIAGIFIILSSILELCNLVLFYTKEKELTKLLKK